MAKFHDHPKDKGYAFIRARKSFVLTTGYQAGACQEGGCSKYARSFDGLPAPWPRRDVRT